MGEETRDEELLVAARQVAIDSRGFEGEWLFDPAHWEDHGIGNIADVQRFDDRLMFVPAGDSVRDDTAHCIIDEIDREVADPMARMLNWAGGLARGYMDADATIVALQAQLDDVADAIGADRMRAADGYHGTAVRKFVREWNAAMQEARGAQRAAAEMREQILGARSRAAELRDAVMAFSFEPDNTALAFAVGVAHRRLEDALGIVHANATTPEHQP